MCLRPLKMKSKHKSCLSAARWSMYTQKNLMKCEGWEFVKPTSKEKHPWPLALSATASQTVKLCKHQLSKKFCQEAKVTEPRLLVIDRWIRGAIAATMRHLSCPGKRPNRRRDGSCRPRTWCSCQGRSHPQKLQKMRTWSEIEELRPSLEICLVNSYTLLHSSTLLFFLCSQYLIFLLGGWARPEASWKGEARSLAGGILQHCFNPESVKGVNTVLELHEMKPVNSVNHFYQSLDSSPRLRIPKPCRWAIADNHVNNFGSATTYTSHKSLNFKMTSESYFGDKRSAKK